MSRNHGIDVVMLTKNSYSKQPKVFERCLQSIKENVPVNKFIIVDAYSIDRTVEVIKKYFNDVVVVKTRAYRGKAREIGIKFVETEYFMFVDDDVILCKDWFKKAVKYLDNPRVGAVWGVAIPAYPWIYKKVKIMSKLYKIQDPRDRLILEFLKRGGTHDILIRTEIVKDIDIPNHLHIYEDWYIKKWVETKGFRFLPVKEPYCLHFHKPLSRKERANLSYWEAMLNLKYNIRTFKEMILYGFLALIKALALLLGTGSPKIATDQAWYYIYLAIGAIKVRYNMDLIK